MRDPDYTNAKGPGIPKHDVDDLVQTSRHPLGKIKSIRVKKHGDYAHFVVRHPVKIANLGFHHAVKLLRLGLKVSMNPGRTDDLANKFQSWIENRETRTEPRFLPNFRIKMGKKRRS